MSFQDKTLTCRDCNQQFVFTAGEQDFYASRGLTNEPGRCPDCRAIRRGQGGGGGGGRTREMFDVICSNCGKQTQVPSSPPRAGRCTAATASASSPGAAKG